MDRFTKRTRIYATLLSLSASAALLLLMLFVLCVPEWTAEKDADDAGVPATIAETEARRDRNRFWTLFNNDCFMPELSTPSFDANLCRVLHPATGDESRLEALLALREMNAARFERDDAGRLVGILRDGPVDNRIGLIRGMTAESEFGMRIAGLTCDYNRMRLFLWGEEVPLE